MDRIVFPRVAPNWGIRGKLNPLSGLNQEEKLLSHGYASGSTRGKQDESPRVTLPWNYIGLYIKENPLKFSGLILDFRGEGGKENIGQVNNHNGSCV